jgi:hypothetical protein
MDYPAGAALPEAIMNRDLRNGPILLHDVTFSAALTVKQETNQETVIMVSKSARENIAGWKEG